MGSWLHQGRRLLRVIGRLIQYLDNRLSDRMLRMPELLSTQYRENMIRVSRLHNMATHPDEPYYRDQYWHWIEKFLEEKIEIWNGDIGRIVDIGCGQGRLTIPLARWALRFDHCDVIGIDLSPQAVSFAKSFAEEQHIGKKVVFEAAEIFNWLSHQPSTSVAAVVCTEVLYTVSNYKAVMEQIARVLIPGGVFIGAFRSRFYNLMHAIETRSFDALPILMNNTEGYPWGPPTKFSWFETKDLSCLLEGLDFEVIDFKGIGVFSGTEGDPLAAIVRPSTLMQNDRSQLMHTELASAGSFADCGRYILALTVKAGGKPASEKRENHS